MERPIVLMGDAGLMNQESYSDEKASVLFKMEAGDPDANTALRLVALLFLWSGKPLPSKLVSFVENALLVGKRSKRGRPSKYFRKLLIVHLVQQVCDQNGLLATRSPAEDDSGDAVPSSKISACLRVATALGLKERAVEDDWDDRDKLRIKVPQPPKRRNRHPA